MNVENGCQSYYLCVNGKDVEKSCPKGMLYNSKLDVCDWPQNVQCQGPYGKVQSRHGASAKKKGIDNSVSRKRKSLKYLKDLSRYLNIFLRKLQVFVIPGLRRIRTG